MVGLRVGNFRYRILTLFVSVVSRKHGNEAWIRCTGMNGGKREAGDGVP